MTMIALAIGSNTVSAPSRKPLERCARRHDAHWLRAPHVGKVVIELLGDAIDGARELAEGRVIAQAQLGDLAAASTRCSA